MQVAIVFLAVIALAMAMPFDVKEFHDKAILGGLLCGECKTLVKGGEHLGADAVEAYVHREIAEVCEAAAFLAGECRKELDKLSDKLVQAIIHKVDPTKACKDIDLC